MNKHTAIAAILLFLTPMVCARGQDAASVTTNDIVSALALRNFQRSTLLAGYQGMRRYTLENKKLNKRAEMLVRVTCNLEGAKQFDIVEEKGWPAANHHVLLKMVESEQKISQGSDRNRTAIEPENYRFQFEGIQQIDGVEAYVVELVPRRNDQFLVNGRMWIDPNDYAILQVEGSPAKKPSFWIRSVHFSHTYSKSGPFWFPKRTRSVSEVIFFGESQVTIDYFDYEPLFLAPTLPKEANQLTREDDLPHARPNTLAMSGPHRP